MFNVRGYGAMGNGVTNDASTIGAAITAASSAGVVVVYFPAGTYVINSPAVQEDGASPPQKHLVRAAAVHSVGHPTALS